MSPLESEVAARTPSRIKTNGFPPSLPSVSLSAGHISDALNRSPDNGATIDLTKQNLTDVGESGVEELATIGMADVKDEGSVRRITLGNNRLTTLPMGFALLSRLRYLNLRNNNFSVFPEVLTVMPSLDTLDISHNKIKRLPSQPGSLANLRVFCFSRNKVVRMPPYIGTFRDLHTLRCDRNPIEWPPKAVMEPSGGLGTEQLMKDWIRSLQKWMEVNSSKSDLNHNHTRNDKSGLENSIEESLQSWTPFPITEKDFDAGVTPHARSFSRDSNFSISSVAESLQELETPISSTSVRPHLLHLSSHSTPTSPSHSPERYLPSPEESADEGFSAVSNAFRQQHARNSSFTSGRHTPRRSDHLAKKSMPDLRTAKLNFAVKFPDRSNHQQPNNREALRSLDDLSIPSPPPKHHDTSSFGDPTHIQPLKPFARDIVESPTSSEKPVPSMDYERNSYFRRLSALPPSTTSTTLPAPLFSLVDSVRSILFAVCQVYQTLQHYTVYAIDDRLSSVLRKVLDPASTDMLQLINSLDRFDVVSRKTLPPPALCRSIVECCKDTVAVFGKAVGVLTLQLKVLATRDDVRYLRQMLLVLYGATAEIAHAWQAMAPQIEAVKPLLREHRRAPVAKTHSPVTRVPAISDLSLVTQTSGAMYSMEKPFLLRTHSGRAVEDGAGGIGVGRTHTARRHAGSFSSKDVEIGKQLPSYDETPFLSAGVVSGIATKTPTLRITKRHLGAGTPTSAPSGSALYPPHLLPFPSSSLASAGAVRPSLTTHSRQGSQASLHTPSTSSSSPQISTKVPFMDLPLNSKSLVDKEALDAMKVAVEAAPAVWEMMSTVLADVLETDVEVRECLVLARILTKRLGECILAVQQGDITADRKGLRDDAHVFVKTVVQLSNVLKTFGGSHAVSSELRSKMVKLTNSTEEFVILLHVSSFSPASTPRSMSSASPAQASSLSAAGGGVGSEDPKLGTGLSRSRSAQPASSLKLTTSAPEAPRSALPNQSFRIPVIQRPQQKLERSIDIGEVSG